jgi:tetratricopeptide (TPR) repeat protein
VAAAQNAQVLGDSIIGKQWGWDTANSIQRSVVSQNLSEVARYIIGLSLLARGRLTDAEQVLGILLAEVEAKYGAKRVPPPVQRFQETLKRAYLESIVHGITVAYRQALNDEQLFDLGESTWNHWSDRLSFVVQRDENTRGVRLLLAIIRFMQKNTSEAKRLLCEEAQKFPKSRMACLVSEAFLLSFEGSYNDARKLYRNLFTDPKTAEVDFLPVLYFLEAVAAHYNEKPELLFLVGLMNDELYDRARALTAFGEFIQRCKNNPELARWIREAKIRRRKIEESATDSPT